MALPRNESSVVIIGGGPAGSVAALELVRRKIAVTVIERTAYERPRVGEVLPPEGAVHLRELGLWENFRQLDPLPSPGIDAYWENERATSSDFIFNPYGVAWHLDRRAFDASLANEAQAEGAIFYQRAQVRSCQLDAHDRWHLRVVVDGAEQSCYADFLIDASGRSAWLARRQGARRIKIDRLASIVAAVRHHSRADDRLLIEAVELGWWYSLLTPPGRLILAYMTDIDNLPRLKHEHGEFWKASLQKTILTSQLAGRHFEIDYLRSVAANTEITQPVHGTSWLAVGDAALSFDPLSSQGIVKAIESGRRAAKAVLAWLNEGNSSLEEYSEWTHQLFRRFLTAYYGNYVKVRRFPDSTFWRRRQLQ